MFAALGLPPGASAFHLICVQRENDVPVQTLLRRTWANGTAVTFARFVHPGTRYRLGCRFKVDNMQRQS